MRRLAFSVWALILLVGCNGVSYVERIVLVNPTDYNVLVDVKGADDSSWLSLGIANRNAETQVHEVIDQGETWVFRFRYVEEAGEDRISRSDLVRNRWRYEIPKELERSLRRRAMPPPSDDRSRNHLSLSPASHVIVCGLGLLGEAVVRILASLGTRTIGIAQEAYVEEIPSTVITIEGDPTSETVLRRASIERASALISTVEGDEDNALICLTARSLSPKIRLVVRGESPQSIGMLDDTGETKTVSKGRR